MTEDATHRRIMRALAVALTVLWVAIAVAVASAYRPGGPVDIVVALACFTPVVVADAGIVWPPVAVERWARAALVWIWIAAVLFAIPLLYGIAVSLTDDGPRSLVPSFEAAYAGAIALFSMSFFSIVGWAHRRAGATILERRATWAAAGLAVVLTLLTGSAFGVVAVVNDQALRRDEPVVSRFGPTDPDVLPPFCDASLRLGDDAQIRIEANSSVDGIERGRARLDGQRGGRDEAWGGSWTRPEGVGMQAYRRVGPRAWINEQSDDPGAPGTTWRQTQPNVYGMRGDDGLTMDGPPHAIVDVPRGEIVPEDLGLEIVEGARARHCRTFMDGATALETFLPLRWLLTGGSAVEDRALAHWRGEMDWWVFGDGELGMARVEVSGTRTETPWDSRGVRAVLEATLEATDRDRPVDVTAPVGAGPASSPPVGTGPASSEPAPVGAGPAAVGAGPASSPPVTGAVPSPSAGRAAEPTVGSVAP